MKRKRTNRAMIKESSITFPITEKMKTEIQKKADERGITMSALIRMVLCDFLDNGDK